MPQTIKENFNKDDTTKTCIKKKYINTKLQSNNFNNMKVYKIVMNINHK